MVTRPGVGMFWEGSLTTAPMKVSQVKLRNAPGSNIAGRFESYRVLIDSTACGTTKADVSAGEEVVVSCGEAPNYISGSKVRVETTTNTNLQLAEVEVIGTDGSQAAIDRSLRNNAGEPCTANGFNSCYNALARARHNDLREGHQWVNAETEAVTITPALTTDEQMA